MKSGSVVIASLPQADGRRKNRPALVLTVLPPFNDAVVCGISTQARVEVADWDEKIGPEDADFAGSGLVGPSVIRVGFLATLARSDIKGTIGAVGPERCRRILQRLSSCFSSAGERMSGSDPRQTK